MGFFLRGLLIGLSVAAPVGPIGLLCIRRTLEQGRAAGFVSGLGAATADMFYGAVAAFGLTFISGFLLDQRGWLRLLGGAFLICLGLRTFITRPAERAASVKTAGPGLVGAYASTLLLTLTNPTTVLSFTAIMAGAGQGTAGTGYGSAIRLLAGVFSGSALWWLLLSTGVGAARARLGRPALQFIQRASGAFIVAFGIAALTWR